MLGAMGDGLPYIRFSFKCLANDLGENIDNGVDVVFNMMGEPLEMEGFVYGDYSKFYDLDYVSNVLMDLFKED